MKKMIFEKLSPRLIVILMAGVIFVAGLLFV